MNRETRRDRRARLAPETLEGRELMSVATLPAIRPVHHHHRHVHPTTPGPQVAFISQFQPGWIDPHLALAQATGPRSAFRGVEIDGPDPKGSVTIFGKTYRRATVTLDLGANGTNEKTVQADARGRFTITVTVGFGTTPLRLAETARGHRAASLTQTEYWSRPQVLTPPGTPSTTSSNSPGTSGSSPTGTQGNSSPGTSGSSQTGFQVGNLPLWEQIAYDQAQWENGSLAVGDAMQLGDEYVYQWI
jgi:hypothetical protein